MLKQYAINLSLFFWQVVRGLLALNNEHAVQIDSHDTLWGETGMFFIHLLALRGSLVLLLAVLAFWTLLP